MLNHKRLLIALYGLVVLSELVEDEKTPTEEEILTEW